MFFVIFAPNFDAADRILDDVKKKENVIYLRDKIEVFGLKEKIKEKDKICFLYFNPWTNWACKSGYISDMKRKYLNSIHIAFFLDIYAARKLDIEGMKEFLTEMFIFDKSEAVNLGISYYPNIYSKIPMITTNITSDVCFVGQAKDRYDDIIKVYEVLSKKGIVCDFYIVGVELEKQKYKNDIKYGSLISYEMACSYIMRSKCVLEIMLKNCNSYSNRVMEAIANNKKILTNNVNVSELAFYNKNLIQIYEDAEKIDVDFLKEDAVEIAYNYNNEFSPVNFLNYIEEKYNG